MRMRAAQSPRKLVLGQSLAFVLAIVAAAVLPATASAAPEFAPAGEATVHPGVVTNTQGAGECTANFVFTNGTDVFIGQAAHCAGTGAATETDGCNSGSLPLGTPVAVDGASRPGTLVYSSWLAMQAKGETDLNACAFNDFALVQLDPADVASTNPSVPFFGGPTGIDTDGTAPFEPVYSYGNSPLRGGIELLSPKVGRSLGTTGGGWTHNVSTVSPGIPGDSGSAFLSADGSALGLLSTLALAPIPASNGVSDLNLALNYANENSDLGTIELVEGTEPFSPSALPLRLPF